MNDADLLYKYGHMTNGIHYISATMELLTNTNIQNKFNYVDITDIESFRAQVNEFLTFCSVVKRFSKLHELFGNKLGFIEIVKQGSVANGPHFQLDGHIFYTLDDIEKCWNNKALL